jgi:hypothetical protein
VLVIGRYELITRMGGEGRELVDCLLFRWIRHERGLGRVNW